jgi:hypothetical protein
MIGVIAALPASLGWFGILAYVIYIVGQVLIGSVSILGFL